MKSKRSRTAAVLSLSFVVLSSVWAAAQSAPARLPEAPSAVAARALPQGGGGGAGYTPLTAGQKFEQFGRAAVNPFFLVGAAASAGIAQAADTNPGYGQGAEGYGKRLGAAVADETSSNFFGNFLYPVIFRQDPRYFRKGKEGGTGGERIGYAVSRVFVTRTDSGGSAFNISKVLGCLTAATLSNAYYSVHEQTGAKTAERFGLSLASQAGFNILREFWPDIWHHNKK